MNIVFIVDHFGNGGAERVVSVLSDEMVKIGHTVSVIVARDEKNYTINSSINYYIANTKSKNKIARRIERTKKIREFLFKISPDAIYSFGYAMNIYAIVAAKDIKNAKFIISERTDPAAEPGNLLARKVRNFFYNYCDILVCQTKQAKEYFPKMLQKKCVVIPNPIKNNLPERYEGKRKNVIVTACRIEKQKNLPLLIKAFEQVHKKYIDYSLVIYGDGSEKNSLIQLVNSLGLEEYVSFPGFENDVHEKMYDCSMYVSSSDYEGISNSMLEAMAIGMTVICTDCPVGGASLAIENGVNGILVPVKDLDKMIAAMLFVIENPVEANNYGINALSVKEKFNVKNISQKWIDLLEV